MVMDNGLDTGENESQKSCEKANPTCGQMRSNAEQIISLLIDHLRHDLKMGDTLGRGRTAFENFTLW